MTDLQPLYEAILNGDAKGAVAATRAGLEQAIPPMDLVNGYMVPAMDEAGRRFEAEDYFVPELLLAARAMKSVLEIIRPLLVQSGAQPAGRVVIGTVKGDLHDIGKNLVASMLEGSGFEVVDLGNDVAPQRFVEAVRDRRPDLVCISALLTVTMQSMKTTIDALREAGLAGRVRVMIGGAPVSEQFARQIGADGYADNANAAVAVARRLVAGEPRQSATTN